MDPSINNFILGLRFTLIRGHTNQCLILEEVTVNHIEKVAISGRLLIYDQQGVEASVGDSTGQNKDRVQENTFRKYRETEIPLEEIAREEK